MSFLKLLAFNLFAAIAAAQGSLSPAGSDCPIAGPAFPFPSHLSSSSALSNAKDRFEALLADKSKGFQTADTAFAVAMFSAKENTTLYEHFYTSPNAEFGVEKVDVNTVFRIASLTKDPITKYVPELASQASTVKPPAGTVYDDINDVRWDEVTLGELLSQTSGIGFDVALGELSALVPEHVLSATGLPPLSEDDVLKCGANATMPQCTRRQFFDLLLKKHPVFPSSHSPNYGNMAFSILRYALEVMSGLSMEEMMTNSIFKPLGLTHSSYSKAPVTGGVIPGNDTRASGWDFNLGEANAAGSVFMSTGDLVKAGQAILQSALLKPDTTRRWLKPKIQTGYLGASVGMPWEISSLVLPNKHLVEYYAKDGDLLYYHSSLVLSPDHDVGFIVLTAGPQGIQLRTEIKNALGEIFMPAVEQQAQVEASTTFDGTYVDDATNSSVTLASGFQGSAGITIKSFVSYGVAIVGPGSPADNLLGLTNTTRLFPTTLKTVSPRSKGSGTFVSRLSFRGAFVPQMQPGVLQDPCMFTWVQVDTPTYGQKAMTDWVFNLSENGAVTSVDLRMFKLNLQKVANFNSRSNKPMRVGRRRLIR
ncbi:Beta-lactamase-like sdnR-like protein [Cladobotryum mycophilum]|uniref:Beta-lactamase-like sdnR-like protein n=1 Tax=Cladobotryum mycophilum TaxID=491253 RepID=A0ABR0SIX9_9HYPO